MITHQLLADGHTVAVLDNFMWDQVSLSHLCMYSGLEIVRGDARDMRVVKPLLKWADAFIPLAALVGAPLCAARPKDAWAVNFGSVKDAVDLMGTDQYIIIATTNSGYGIGEKDQVCDETSPLKPISLYGQTKVEAEKAAFEHKNAISLRLATLFGMSPRMRIDLLVNDFVWRAIRDHAVVLFEMNFRRNFVHVRDAAYAFTHALENFKAMRGQSFNVGLSDANLTKFELCQLINEYIPFSFAEAPIAEDPDKRDYVVSNAKIEATGWNPQYTLPMGIVELKNGYRMFKSFEYGNI